MTGGLAVRANLLCVTWSSARGHVFLFDLEARLPVSSWAVPTPPGGYSDAAGVAMDDRFHLFVADPSNDCVRHFSAFGRHLGDLGLPAPAAGDASRDKRGVLHHPVGVAVYHDDVWVACGDRPLRRGVQRLDRDGRVLTPLRSNGDPERCFGAPRGVWADRHGVVVADTLHGSIQRFLPGGGFVADIRLGAADQRARPVSVARPHRDLLLVVDAGDRAGVVAMSPDGREAAAPAFDRCEAPLCVTVDAAGRVYVLDRHGERVMRFLPDLTFDCALVDLTEYLDGFQPGSP